MRMRELSGPIYTHAQNVWSTLRMRSFPSSVLNAHARVFICILGIYGTNSANYESLRVRGHVPRKFLARCAEAGAHRIFSETEKQQGFFDDRLSSLCEIYKREREEERSKRKRGRGRRREDGCRGASVRTQGEAAALHQQK